MRNYLVLVLLVCVFSTPLFGQSRQRIHQLQDALANNSITLTANGNGSSSGMSVDGTIKNNTGAEILINVILDNGLYFKNSGVGQNMIATQIFLGDNTCVYNGTFYYISIPPNREAAVTFLAFCADFERSNPSSSEQFSSAALPDNLKGIAAKISKYMENTIFEDEITAVQLALWHYQGVNRSSIAEQFVFDDSDWELAASIINN